MHVLDQVSDCRPADSAVLARARGAWRSERVVVWHRTPAGLDRSGGIAHGAAGVLELRRLPATERAPGRRALPGLPNRVDEGRRYAPDLPRYGCQPSEPGG